MLLKKYYLNTKVKKTIKITLKFINEKHEKIATLTVIIYKLNEKKLYTKKKLNNDTLINKSQLEKNSKKNFANSNFNKLNVINKIKIVYLNNVILQRIIKNKQKKHKYISTNITKTKIKLKLNDCELKNDIFYIKERIYMFYDKTLQILILNHIYNNSSKKHAKKVTTYNKVNCYYF